MWDETVQRGQMTSQNTRLPLTSEYLAARRNGESVKGIAMSIMQQSGQLLIHDVNEDRTVLNEPIVCPLVAMGSLRVHALLDAISLHM
eukprot:487119-Pyramimonas_sp.AAC.1